MKNNNHFQTKDRVRHPQRPEWGVGTVLSVAAVMHEGQRFQRLTVDFENHGRANIHTAYAPLIPADSPPSPTPTESDRADPRVAQASPSPVADREALLRLPHETNDPKSPLAARLRATLSLYRYPADARGTHAWAVSMTRLADPLSEFARQELDQAFTHFRYLRDKHLRQLYAQTQHNRQDAEFLQLVRQLEPEAQIAIQKALDTR